MSGLPLRFEQPLDVETIITPWRKLPHKTLIFKNANVIDPIDGSIAKNATLMLENGLVGGVYEASSTCTLPQSTNSQEVIELDLEGKYVMPGLWDCHVHLLAVQGCKSFAEILDLPPEVAMLRQPEVGQAMLDRGFTTVRDCGGALYSLKQAFEEGVHPGPRLFIAGRQLTQSGGSGDKRSPYDDSMCCGGTKQLSCRTVDGVPECLKFAREELRLGADFIKIMGGGGVSADRGGLDDVDFTPEEIRAITAVTSNANTFATAHAYTPKVIQAAVNNGVLGIEHGNYMDRETAELMAQKGVYYTPTLVAYAVGEMPEFGGFLTENSMAKLKRTYESGLNALRIAKEAGVTICFGTDLLGPMHFAQTKEFQVRSSVLSPLEIIQSATVTAARMMKRQDSLGRVAPGFLADLLILNANPLEDITVLDRPEKHLLAVFKEGRVVVSRWSKLQVHSRRPVNIA